MGFDLLYAVFLGTIVFAIRIVQWYFYLGRRLKGSFLSNVDTWWFLIDAEKVRDHGFKLSSRLREQSFEAYKYYPPLFFYLLALVPRKFVEPAVKYSPALADAFIAAVLSVSVIAATNNLVLAALAVGVYLSSPMIFQQTFCLCIRPLSILLISLIFFFSPSFSWLNFAVVAILVTFTLLLHKFAAQIVFFTSLSFLFIGRFDYLLSVAAGFLISLAISGGYYLKVLRAHLNHLKSSYLRQVLESQGGSPLRKIAALGAYCPWLVFFIASIFVLSSNVFSVPFSYLLVWIITLLLLAVLTNFWKFTVIGEGYRYLGYMIFPLAFWVAYTFEYSPNLLWVYVIFIVVSIVTTYYYVLRLFSKHQPYLISEADIEIFKQISSIDGHTIAALPKEFTYALSYFSGKDYMMRLELDFEERAAKIADIVVLNKECATASMYEEVTKRGYSVKFEKGKWTVFTRSLPVGSTAHLENSRANRWQENLDKPN